MAFFDPLEQRLCVRIVYDGAAGAGKTTNLHQLASLFASAHKSRVESSYEIDGRTLYFDWLQIRAGFVAGIPLLCQIVSVPGQVLLTPRRRHLLATADAIVYVCDSRPADLPRSREGLGIVAEVAAMRGYEVPLVLQSNQQDRRGALDGARVAEALGLTLRARVDAIATEGLGVVDTFVAVVRDLSRDLRERTTRGELQIEVRRALTRASVLAEVDALPVDPEGAAEMLLEGASAAFLLEELNQEPRPEETEDELRRERETLRIPRGGGIELPTPDVPAGFIWPAYAGRDTLRRISDAGSLRARAFSGEDGSYVARTEGFVFRTHVRQRFDTAEEARQALVRAAREWAQLDELTLPDTLLVASQGAGEAYWIWSVVPDLESLATALQRTVDPPTKRRWLEAYGVALGEVARLLLRHGIELSASASAFGWYGERLRYLGDTGPASPSRDPKLVVAEALADLERLEPDTSLVVSAYEREAQRTMTPEELARALGGSFPPTLRRVEVSTTPARKP